MNYLNKFKALFAEDGSFEAKRNQDVVNIKNVYSKLLDLSQFIELDEGALNVMNGCLVELHDHHLVLIWHRGGYPTIAQKFYLDGSNVDKFLNAMVLQATLS